MNKIQTIFCRRETKYLITAEQMHRVLGKMGDRIVPDEYGRSTICNLYYDTPDYLLIRRSIEKPVYKEKLRLRSYGTPKAGGKVFAEIKKKYKSIVYKRRITLPAEEEENAAAGNISGDSQIAKEILYFFERYAPLAPRVYLSYEREAFYGVNDRGFRVTFDDNILARACDLRLTDGSYGTPLLPEGMILMEVKCEGALPLWMAKLLSEEKMYKTSFSKYGTAYAMILQNKLQGDTVNAKLF